ncbi:hypothetical protein KC901_02765 [Patescibacteria group bacterium]|nr:hypothetical protein [Patescibacteria group bacterium]
MLRYFLQHVTISVLVVAGLFIAGNIYAQELELYSADDIFVETIPRVPGPNQQVTLKLNSYSFNLNNYYISWFRDGNKESSGYGQRDFAFQTGNSGDITNITAVVDFEGQILRKELRFAPSQVDLLWEVTDGYAPPFYKGKILPVKQSDIHVTAIPETLLIEPTDAPNLVYYWDRNYNRQGSQSGFGKQSYSFTADPLQPSEKITVTTNDRRENSVATSTIDIPTSDYTPKILFYEIGTNKRLMTNKAINTNNVIHGDTIRFSFQPLFMSSVKDNFVDLFVDWSVNNQSQPPQDFSKQNELYITSGGISGTTSITVGLTGIQKLLQKATGHVDLVFNAK